MIPVLRSGYRRQPRHRQDPPPGRRRTLLPAFAVGLLAVALAVVPVAPVAGATGPAKLLTRIPTADRLIALTFDAGSDAGHTQAILDLLAEEGITATFFLTGAWLERFPELGRAVAESGHELGNHTTTHPHLTELTAEEIARELRTTEEAAAGLGRPLTPFFRPPYGEYDQRVSQTVNALGYRYLVMWTVDSWDWKLIPAAELTERVLSGAAPGAIILMHVGSQTNTPEALPGLIDGLRAQGYRFGTLSDLLDNVPPGFVFHTVGPGDTLSGIAQDYQVTVEQLVSVNDLDVAAGLAVGQPLLIPDPTPDQGGHGRDEPGPGEEPPPGNGGPAGGGDWGDEEPRGFWARLAGFWNSIGDALLALVRRVAGLLGR